MTWLRLLLVLVQLYLCLLLYTRSPPGVPVASPKPPPTTRANIAERNPPALQKLRVCHASSFEIPNQPFRFEIEYQCSGPVYDEFSARLAELEANAAAAAEEEEEEEEEGQRRRFHGPTWGRRAHVLPPGTSVLFLGNSHTKQTHNQLACQYADSLVGFEGLHHAIHGDAVAPRSNGTTTTAHAAGAAVSDYTSYVLRFRNGASVYLVYNSPVEVARDWQGRLEAIVRRPLSSFDAVVLGQFNGAGRDIRNTSYYRSMRNWTLAERGDGALPGQSGSPVEPPDVLRLAHAYRGPIVFVSNYDVGKVPPATKILQVIREISEGGGRSNVVGIMSRRYIPELGGNECGTDVRQTNRSTVPDCGARHARSHRCVGRAGGHPSLIAHDVQEALFSLLEGR